MMNKQERLTQVILAPHASEKSARLEEESSQLVVTFKVLKNANKLEIKKAVELLFKVEVESVQTVLQKGKAKRLGRFVGKRSDWKKAYITLKKGQNIDFVGGA